MKSGLRLLRRLMKKMASMRGVSRPEDVGKRMVGRPHARLTASP